MKRLVRVAAVLIPLLTFAVVHTYADVKTREFTNVKFEGFLGKMYGMFGGKAAKEGVNSTAAVKGNRKATLNDLTGQIIDLSEEKVYDLNVKRKEYTVRTFEQIRQKMREDAERAKQDAAKEEPAQKGEPEKPQQDFEVDFDIKETGQKKQVAGYDTHETIVTITVREKGKALEDGGGMVMTVDTWLGPAIPELKELADFDMRYYKQLAGPQMMTMSPEQAAQVMALYPMFGPAMQRLQKDGSKMSGTPLETVTKLESVKSADQMTQAQQSSQSSGGGGISGILAKKMMKKEAPTQRATVFTSTRQVLEVSKSVAESDLAIPADFKEKK